MKVGGGLNYVTGPMGSGKSLYGTRRIVEYVTSGKHCVTNVELYPEAPERIAAHMGRFSTKRKRQRIADNVRRYYHLETTLTEALRYRVPGRGEARALFVWDETHNDLNNRNWRERQKANATGSGVDSVLEWATQLRKLGFVGFLLSQHHENTDAALRRVCNYLVRLQNQRENARIMGVRVTPIPLFLAWWYATNIPQGSTQKPVKAERYFLSWHKNLYDTHGLYHGVAEAETNSNLIWLPAAGEAALPPKGEAAPPGQAAGLISDHPPMIS